MMSEGAELPNRAESKPGLCLSCGKRILRDSPTDNCPRCILEAVIGNTRNTLAWDGSPNRAESSISSLPLPIEPRYERGLPIAKGGMGEVIEARELPVGRRVAMKVIHEAQRSGPGFPLGRH